MFPSTVSQAARLVSREVSYQNGSVGASPEPTTIHGLRSTFRDWAAESGQRREIAEAALAHVVGGVEGAYFRSDLFEARRAMMDRWASLLSHGTSREGCKPSPLEILRRRAGATPAVLPLLPRGETRRLTPERLRQNRPSATLGHGGLWLRFWRVWQWTREFLRRADVEQMIGSIAQHVFSACAKMRRHFPPGIKISLTESTGWRRKRGAAMDCGDDQRHDPSILHDDVVPTIRRHRLRERFPYGCDFRSVVLGGMAGHCNELSNAAQLVRPRGWWRDPPVARCEAISAGAHIPQNASTFAAHKRCVMLLSVVVSKTAGTRMA